MTDSKQAVLAALRRVRRVLIVPHVNPDGDAVGSAFALAQLVAGQGGEARLFFRGGIPGYLSWLQPPAPVVASLEAPADWTPDCVWYVDCGDADRAGADLSVSEYGVLPVPGWEEVLTVNTDHHISNPGFARINWVEPRRAATGELIGMLAEELGVELSGELGKALYLALVSDTGNFSYGNTSAECLGMAARIVAAGLDVASFTAVYENNWTLQRMHLWGRLMSEIVLHSGGAVAASVVPLRYLEEAGLKKEDLEGFASWLRRLAGVRVALFVREDGPGRSKVSLRSMGDVDVQEVASLFGGGGHAAAAGAELSLPAEEAAKEILAVLEQRVSGGWAVSSNH